MTMCLGTHMMTFSPQVNIVYDRANELVNIDVRAKYIAQDMTYRIRFSDFNVLLDDIWLPGEQHSIFSGGKFHPLVSFNRNIKMKNRNL